MRVFSYEEYKEYLEKYGTRERYKGYDKDSKSLNADCGSTRKEVYDEKN
jgi:hypothetical protein